MTNKTNSIIKKKVMKRIYIIYVLRPLVSTGTISAFVLMTALWGIGKEVWVAHVFSNMPQLTNITAFTQFWTYAFLHTHFVVQALTIMAVIAIVYFASSVSKLITSTFTTVSV